ASNSLTSRNVFTCRSGKTRRCTGAFGLMSSTATNPSALLTVSPSRRRRQKRQSGCEANDSLLCHVMRAGSDELAGRPIDEPRRVVVAVAPSGPVDEHRLLYAQLADPAAATRLRGQSPQPGAALLLHFGRNTVLTGRSRPRPWRV